MDYYTLMVICKDRKDVEVLMEPYVVHYLCKEKYLIFEDKHEETVSAYLNRPDSYLEYPIEEYVDSYNLNIRQQDGRYGEFSNPNERWESYYTDRKRRIPLEDGKYTRGYAKIKNVDWTKDNSGYISFAVIDDNGKWNSKADDMFGSKIILANNVIKVNKGYEEIEEEWPKEFYNRFIKDVDPEKYVVYLEYSI